MGFVWEMIVWLLVFVLGGMSSSCFFSFLSCSSSTHKTTMKPTLWSAWVAIVCSFLESISFWLFFALFGHCMVADGLVFMGDRNKIIKEYQGAKVQEVAGQVQSCWTEVEDMSSYSTRCKVQYEFGGQTYEAEYIIPNDSPLGVGHHMDVLVLPDFPRSGKPRSHIQVSPVELRCFTVFFGVVWMFVLYGIPGYVVYGIPGNLMYGSSPWKFAAFMITTIAMTILLLREKMKKDFRDKASLVGTQPGRVKWLNYILCLPKKLRLVFW